MGTIDLILASPECTNHSPARGNSIKSEEAEHSRMTAFHVVRFARVLKPRWIVVENVISMKKWMRYPEFLRKLKGLGYHIREQVLDAADFGVPQSRKRLFITCSLSSDPPEIVPPAHDARKPARSVIDLNGQYSFSDLRTTNRAKSTVERANRAIRALGRHAKFLIVYYGSDGAGGWQGLGRPLRTVTTLDRFALVRPANTGHQMRMLQVSELKVAMGLPQSFKLLHGTRRERIRMLGNAVCPPVVETIVRSLVRQAKGKKQSVRNRPRK